MILPCRFFIFYSKAMNNKVWNISKTFEARSKYFILWRLLLFVESFMGSFFGILNWRIPLISMKAGLIMATKSLLPSSWKYNLQLINCSISHNYQKLHYHAFSLKLKSSIKIFAVCNSFNDSENWKNPLNH